VTSNNNCFVEFEVSDQQRFEALVRAFDALKADKDSEKFRDTEDWLEFFDDEALAHFWWPSKEEATTYWKKRKELENRLSTEELHYHDVMHCDEEKWDFESMLLAIEDGEYWLDSCQLISDTRAQLQFFPVAYPYGGIDSLIALVEAFGFEVVRTDDGTGPKPFARRAT
jgi:hypothetical protein